MNWKKKLQTWVGPAFVLVIFFASLWVLHYKLRDYHLHDLMQSLSEIGPWRLWAAIGLTALNYVLLVGYDLLGIAYLRHPMKLQRVALASFLGYAVGNNFGTLLGGSTIRYRLYSSWGLSAIEVVKLVLILGVTYWIGLFALAAVTFIIFPLPIPDELALLPVSTTRPLGYVLAIPAIGYLVLCWLRRSVRWGNWELAPPPLSIGVLQYLVAALDLLVASCVMYVLLPPSLNISFPHYLCVYLLAIVAGFLSQIPGGLGATELVFMEALVPNDQHLILGPLLIWRTVYYLVPLLVGLALLAGHEVALHHSHVKAALGAVKDWATTIAPRLLAVGVFAAGVILLFSAATPANQARMEWLHGYIPLYVLETSHFVSSFIGALLLVLARGLQRRIDAAYWTTIALLAIGALASLLKGFDYQEAVVLLVILGVMIPCRGDFYRKGALFSERFTARWILAIVVVFACTAWLAHFAYKHVEYQNELWWQFMLDGHAPRSLRAIVAALAAMVVVAFFRLLRVKQAPPPLPTEAEIAIVEKIVAGSPDTSANLALLGDKHFLIDLRGAAFVMYGIEGQSWIALGDPVGEDRAGVELAWQFREECDAAGTWPVFYHIDGSKLTLYVEMGLTLIKLGEEARVPLVDFTLEGSSRKNLRHANKHVLDSGFTFEMLPVEQVPAVLPRLHEISDAWLQERNTAEKGFSLGFFDENYLSHYPVAVVRRGEHIVAFANVWQGANKEELSIDLMRHATGSPAGVMEFLFVQLMLWGHKEGYKWFNLGMAPLSGVEAEPLAPLWNHVAQLAYRHGEHFYNFQGLRQYKEKFDPVWQPKYLASPGGLALPIILTNVSTLIAGGLRGLIAK